MKPLKNISDLVGCVYDRGTFYPVAERLARDCKKIYYHCPLGKDYQSFAVQCRGDGQKDVKLALDFFDIKSECDFVVFPDCFDGGLQRDLESQGFPVWGGKHSYRYEIMRGVWLKACEKMGLPMPKTHKLQGLTKLRQFLRANEGETFHIKISKYRDDMETWQAKERHQIENKLDLLALKFGPFKERITFYAQEPVETDIEGGADSYFVNGQYPDKVVLGYEKKGESYFATWQEREEMPDAIWGPSEAITDLLASRNYCNFVSTEVRVKDDESYLLDPCLRCPSPAGEEQLELYANMTEIIYMGARGEMVQPKMAAKFCGEAVISYCGDKDGWKSVVVPEEVRRMVKLYANAYCDGAHHFPPCQDPEAIGCAIALGDTPDEVLEGLKEIREALGESSVEVRIEPLADLFKEIEHAEKEGIKFSDHEMPEPADAIAS